MRHIDDIIQVVLKHPYLSETHKQVLIARISKFPTQEEIEEAREVLEANRKNRER